MFRLPRPAPVQPMRTFAAAETEKRRARREAVLGLALLPVTFVAIITGFLLSVSRHALTGAPFLLVGVCCLGILVALSLRADQRMRNWHDGLPERWAEPRS